MNTIINAITKAKEIQFAPLERYFLEDTPCYWEGDIFLSDVPMSGFANDEFLTLVLNDMIPLELVRINNLDGKEWVDAINTRLATVMVSVMQAATIAAIDVPTDTFPPKGHPLYDLFVVYGAISLRVVVSEGKECILRTPKTEEAFDAATKKIIKEVVSTTFTFTDVVNVKKVNDEMYARNAFLNDTSTRNGFGAF